MLARGVDVHFVSDQIQECFIRLWKNCTKVTEEKALSYLFTTASRYQIDEFRKKKIRLKYKESLNFKQHDSKDAQFLMEENEFKEKLESVIGSMKEKSRIVFILNRYDKMTYKEIANTLGISVKAVEKRMSVALKHLLTNKINLKR